MAGAVRATAAIAFAVQLASCSSPAPPPAPVATQQSASAHVDPDSFSGPIIMHCLALSKSTTISKLNLDTGELATIAIFPNYCGSGSQWNTNYSPDFRKVVNWMPRSDNHVGYYDSRTGVSTDVTNVVAPPPAGDFGMQTIPQHAFPQFDDKGLFVFLDVKAGEYKFFDTESRQVVRSSKTYYPRYLPQLALNPVVVKRGELPQDQNSRLCDAKWIIDDSRYLRTIHDNQGNYQLVVEPIPRSADRPNCNEVAGQRVTPPGNEIWEAAADPSGSTIVFLVESRTNGKALNLYRVNTKDPDHPTQIKLASDLLDTAGLTERGKGQVVSFVGWR
ncbi:hypothetical protein [Mycobacteroides abscessus]|uniref:hypothetical protein n=1 Tax=Mycobacteroides abscessus TaxID=36809 RepID=UPI001F2D4897|nr:hypothetical protein [Mycobacteroides abscessus]